MISSISSSTISMIQSGSMQRPPPPPGEDVFQVADTDSDGVVSASELKTLVAGIEEVTGNSLDVGEALDSFDLDQDGALSGEELLGLLNDSGFQPPMRFDDTSGETMMEKTTPPPPPPEDVASAYGQNSGGTQIDQLLEYLQSQTGSAEGVSSVNVSA